MRSRACACACGGLGNCTQDRSRSQHRCRRATQHHIVGCDGKHGFQRSNFAFEQIFNLLLVRNLQLRKARQSALKRWHVAFYAVFASIRVRGGDSGGAAAHVALRIIRCDRFKKLDRYFGLEALHKAERSLGTLVMARRRACSNGVNGMSRPDALACERCKASYA